MLAGAVVAVQTDGRVFCNKSVEEGRHYSTRRGGELDVRATSVRDGQHRPSSVPCQPHGLLPDQGQLVVHPLVGRSTSRTSTEDKLRMV